MRQLLDPPHKFERNFSVKGGDFAAAGEIASKVKKILMQLGLAAEVIRRIAVAVYEAELNIVIHAFEGEIVLRVDLDKVILIARDSGPGIKDIALAMQEGYSTASEEARRMGFGAGMGLPNMQRCSDQLVIYSETGKGTTVTMTFDLG